MIVAVNGCRRFCPLTGTKGDTMNNTTYVEEIELTVEEMEEVIAPILLRNHNETLDVDLSVEEMEEVIAPILLRNHNETLVSDAE
jgi:hypothetical protein